MKAPVQCKSSHIEKGMQYWINFLYIITTIPFMNTNQRNFIIRFKLVFSCIIKRPRPSQEFY